ncbi:RHS repeat-associated core domain-containing protein, partial [Humidesulfovibrio mexicanus]
DYDADTGRFTALDPLGAKGGDRDWYGYCVDDPVNRVDVWGLNAIALPGPFGIPLPPVFIPGTQENDEFTKGTLNVLKGLDDAWSGPVEPDSDPNTYESEHTSNRNPSNRKKHEKGQARKQQAKSGEKKNKHPDWRINQNKRHKDQSVEGSPDKGGFVDTGDTNRTEDNV